MIVSFQGNFKDVEGEGLVSCVNNLRKGLLSKEVKIVYNEPVKQAHIHTSGFLVSIKYFFSKNKPKISFYGNLDAGFFLMLKNHWQYFFLLYNETQPIIKEIKHVFFSILSTAIPVFIKRFFINKFSEIIVPSDYFKKKLRNENVKVIHLGIDIKKFKNKNLKNKKLTIAYFGHNSPIKGVIECIKTFSILKEEDYDFRIYLTKFSRKTEKLAHKYNKNVKVCGFVNDIVEEYNKCDIIVLPFWSPGGAIATPLVLLESMACERAIVTSNLSHIREIVGGSAICVNPFYPKQLASAVRNLARDKKERVRLGKMARNQVISNYDLNQMIEEYARLYKK